MGDCGRREWKPWDVETIVAKICVTVQDNAHRMTQYPTQALAMRTVPVVSRLLERGGWPRGCVQVYQSDFGYLQNASQSIALKMKYVRSRSFRSAVRFSRSLQVSSASSDFRKDSSPSVPGGLPVKQWPDISRKPPKSETFRWIFPTKMFLEWR